MSNVLLQLVPCDTKYSCVHQQESFFPSPLLCHVRVETCGQLKEEDGLFSSQKPIDHVRHLFHGSQFGALVGMSDDYLKVLTPYLIASC